MRQVNENIIPLKATADTTTAAIPALNLLYVSAQLTSTSTVTGVLKLQASNDDFVNGSPPANWSDIPSATVTAITGGGAFLIPKTDLCYQWIRLVYTSAGAGNISVVFKAIGE